MENAIAIATKIKKRAHNKRVLCVTTGEIGMLKDVAERIAAARGVAWQGVYSHISSACLWQHSAYGSTWRAVK